jgi:hypothetical protein
MKMSRFFKTKQSFGYVKFEKDISNDRQDKASTLLSSNVSITDMKFDK